jgi:hypothetical protein
MPMAKGKKKTSKQPCQATDGQMDPRPAGLQNLPRTENLCKYLDEVYGDIEITRRARGLKRTDSRSFPFALPSHLPRSKNSTSSSAKTAAMSSRTKVRASLN